jgi:hypothetical protein
MVSPIRVVRRHGKAVAGSSSPTLQATPNAAEAEQLYRRSLSIGAIAITVAIGEH